MTIQKDNLRLHLAFLDELKNVQVMGAVNHIGANMRKLGIAKGKSALEDLLAKAGIDHYIRCSGDIMLENFKATAFEKSPSEIVETLEKGFHRADELQDKILDGGILTDEDRSFGVPTTLWVCSSSVKTDEGLKRIQDWFQATDSGAAAKLVTSARKTGAQMNTK